MRTLYHYHLCPYSRKVRLVLAEKKLDFTLELEKFWEGRTGFLAMNHAGQVPVLIDLNGTIIPDSNAICEYLEEAYNTDLPLIGEALNQRAEIRRLVAWFDNKFGQEVSHKLLFERVIKKYLPKDRHYAGGYYTGGSSGPDSAAIRSAKSAINYHLDYISWLVQKSNWLAGDNFSLADITAAAHISVVDYFGDVPWSNHPDAKHWYSVVKSRPSFRGILQDKISGTIPAPHYGDLDF